MRYLPGTLLEARRRNGVGRPPAIRKRQEAKWAENPRNVIKASGVTLQRGDLPRIACPPGRFVTMSFGTPWSWKWCRKMISSTTALRKSKQRKGRI